jgi:low temperature requirement protein LtrA
LPAAEPGPSTLAAAARRTSNVELLWDLVFVFAVTQISTLLVRDLTWAGFARSFLVMALVWWAWSAFVWTANADDPNSGAVRAVLLLATVLIFITALALPQAYSAGALLFAATYTVVRLLHLALYVNVWRRGHASFRSIVGFAITVLVGMALLIAGAAVGGGWLIVLWVAAAAIDYAGPGLLTRRQLVALQAVAVEHFAERYGLFVIICLGESVVAIGAGAAGHGLDAAAIAGTALMLLITIALWWSYFDRLAATAEEGLRTSAAPVLAASDAYSYIHLILVAGIIVFAAGARIAVGRIDRPLATAESLALGGGIAMYLFGLVAFRARITKRFGFATALGAVAAAAVGVVGANASAWVEAVALLPILAAVQLMERRSPST